MWSTVYPRTGGGNRRPRQYWDRSGGLSPHGRGKPASPPISPTASRSIPARAGETRWDGGNWNQSRVYPRTGGGNQSPFPPPSAAIGLSPHGRGKPVVAQPQTQTGGSIPARAGETPGSSAPHPVVQVYPRTGGGNPLGPAQQEIAMGLSPHGRGKPAGCRPALTRSRSIPARAGETAHR